MTVPKSPARIALLQAFANQVSMAESVFLQSLGVSLVDALADEGLKSHLHVGLSLLDVAKSIVPFLLADEKIGRLEHMMLQQANGASTVNPQFIAPAILRHALTSSVEEAVAWLDAVVDARFADGYLILTIWGVQVEHPVQLTSELTLVPTAQLPASRTKDLLQDFRGNHNLMTCFDFELPSAAVVKRTQISPLFRHHDDESTSNDYQTSFTLLYEVASLLSLVGPQLSIPAVSWFVFADSAIERLQLGASRGQRALEVIPSHIPQAQPLDAEECIALVSAYLALDSTVAERIQLATERLSLALRRHDPADRSVELSIALESLLTDQTANEVTHKVKVRATRFLGGTDELRAFNFGVIGRTYEIRSKLVHTGKREKKSKTIGGHSLTPDQVVKHTATLCAQLIKKIIFSKCFPDWSTFDIS